MPKKSRNESEDGVPGKETHAGDVARRYEITVEREFLSVKSHAGQGSRAHCPHCGREVQMLPADLAAEAAGITARMIYRWVEEKRVHYIEPAPGVLLICSESLRGPSSLPQIGPGESK
jgi:hypothetical protein